MDTSILIVGIVGTGSSKSEACCYAITAVDVKGKMQFPESPRFLTIARQGSRNIVFTPEKKLYSC